MASTNENSSVKSRTHTLKRVLRVRAPKELAKYDTVIETWETTHGMTNDPSKDKLEKLKTTLK